MRVHLEQMMERYGQTVALVPGDGNDAQEIRAFVQPILKEQTEPPVAVTPLGPVSEHRWLYIGQAGVEVSVGDRISCGKDRLIVQEAQAICWRNEILYRRAILASE